MKDKAKRPMGGEYATLMEQLKEANTKIKELEISCNSYKDELLDTKRENERLNKIIGKHDQALELKEKELQENQNMIKKSFRIKFLIIRLN